MSVAQQFKAALSALAATERFQKGISLRRDSSGRPSPPLRAAFQQSFTVVLVEASGWLNVAASMSADSLAEVG